jgi:hypothetical protein
MRPGPIVALIVAVPIATGCGSASTEVEPRAAVAPVESSSGAAGSPTVGASGDPATPSGATTRPVPDPTAGPTLDPTLEALYADFAPPIRGSDNAPLVLYEFSDFT